MILLKDAQLKELVRPSNSKLRPIIEGIKEVDDWYSLDSPVQPSSIDLHINSIFEPGNERFELGGEKNPFSQYFLKPGKTVMVETKEVIKMPPYLAGIGFPPSKIAVRGILMTNPGHIDPGYEGKLSFTLINMGKDIYPLRMGDKIFSILIFHLDGRCKKSLKDRKIGLINSGGVKQENIDALNKDFMNVEKRAKKIIVRNGLLAGVIVTSIALLGTGAMQYLLNNNEANLESRVLNIENEIKKVELENKLNEISGEIENIRNKLRGLAE